MQLFEFSQVHTITEAIKLGALSRAKFIAGGTTLLDLMKLNVEQPSLLVDINNLPFNKIKKLSDGCLSIGALVRNSDCAHDELVKNNYSLLSQALLAGASGQLRNMATMGGNLLQRTRCMYFRNDSLKCNKREAGSGCPAIQGQNRSLAILGTSEHCIATNASDMNVALTALEAMIHSEHKESRREVNINDFFLVPRSTPAIENILKPGELVSFIVLPVPRPLSRQVYVKLRDRASYEFALSSTALIIEITNNIISFVRIALGGVGTKPWRSFEAEQVLLGQPVGAKIFHQAALAALKDAQAQSQNGFKIELTKRCIIHALNLATKSP